MLQVDIDTRDGGTVVIPRGRLTVVSAKSFRETVTAEIDRGSGEIVVVDLSQTEFVDSSGLGALIGGLKRARVAGGDLRIAAVPEQVHAVLRLTNLDRVLSLYETPETAFDGR